MIQTIDDKLLTVQKLTYFDDIVQNKEDSFIAYEIDTSSYAEEYDREDDQEARFVGTHLENCKVYSTDPDDVFSSLYFNESYLNNIYIEQLECYYSNLRYCSIKTLSLAHSKINSLRFDGIIIRYEDNPPEIEEELPLYSADCIILDVDSYVEYLKLETFRIKHLIINTNNKNLRLIIQLKNHGLTKNSSIDRITINSDISLQVNDHTGTFKNTKIIKVGEGLRSKINTRNI